MTPYEQGLRTAPPWAPPARFWMGWPPRTSDPLGDDMAQDDCLGLAALLSDYAPVTLLAHPDDVALASLRTPPEVAVVAAGHQGHPLGRAAPLLMVEAGGRPMVGLGGIAPLAGILIEGIGIQAMDAPAVIDPSLITLDGLGTALAVASLADNAGMSLTEAEQVLAQWVGIERVIWLDPADPEGRMMPARFVAPGLVAAAFDRDNEALKVNRGRIVASRDAGGRPLAVVDLPCPRKHRNRCYVDCLLAGELVVVPEFEDRNDQEAFDRLVAALPDRRVIAFPASCLGTAGGGLGSLVVVEPRGSG